MRLHKTLLQSRPEFFSCTGLPGIEALLLDVRQANRGRFLVVDLARWTTKHARRFVPVAADAERLVPGRAARAFSDVDSGPLGPEGNYRQRLHPMKKLFKEGAAHHVEHADAARTKLNKRCDAPLSGLAFAR